MNSLTGVDLRIIGAAGNGEVQQEGYAALGEAFMEDFFTDAQVLEYSPFSEGDGSREAYPDDARPMEVEEYLPAGSAWIPDSFSEREETWLAEEAVQKSPVGQGAGEPDESEGGEVLEKPEGFEDSEEKELEVPGAPEEDSGEESEVPEEPGEESGEWAEEPGEETGEALEAPGEALGGFPDVPEEAPDVPEEPGEESEEPEDGLGEDSKKMKEKPHTNSSPEEDRSADETAAEERGRAEHEASEAKRKAEWEARQQAKKEAVKAQLERIRVMNDEELASESMKRVGADTEKLTRRNMKECVSEYVQTACLEDAAFARQVMLPQKNMVHCFQYINRKAYEYVQDEMKANGIQPGRDTDCYASDIPDGLCYHWAEEYFRTMDVKEDKEEEEKFVPKPYLGKGSSSGKPAGKKAASPRTGKTKTKTESRSGKSGKGAADGNAGNKPDGSHAAKKQKAADDGQLSFIGQMTFGDFEAQEVKAG